MDLAPAIAKGIADRDIWTQLPVHGLNAAHDRACGREGAFRALVGAFATLKEHGARYSTSTVASRENLGELRDILEFSVAMGSRYLLMIRFLPGGAGLKRTDLLLDPRETQRAYDILDEVCGYYGIRGGVGVPNLPCMIDEKRYRHIDMSSCGAGKRWFVVGPSGELRLCNHSPTVYGNILRRPLEEILAHPALRDFAADRVFPEACAGCSRVAACRGGCRAAAETFSGDLRGPDPMYREGARLPGFAVSDRNQ
jgi:radical SAM protein with 4Fe4S-binding SPASM domain